MLFLLLVVIAVLWVLTALDVLRRRGISGRRRAVWMVATLMLPVIAIPLYWAIKRLSPGLYFGATAAVTAAGIWASNRMADSLGDEDPSCVVIDEVAGALLALGLVRGRGWRSELVALILFRALDIAKPGPIKWSERARPPGLGIMLDDVVAGGLAGVISRLL